MIINAQSLQNMFIGYSGRFKTGLGAAPSHWRKIAMEIPSSTSEETYAWIGQFPQMREWIGSRVINNVAANGFTIKNRKFEQTIAVERDKVADDQFMVYGAMFEHLGFNVSEHPDRLVFDLIANGFTRLCEDGQYFFDTDHPVIGADGSTRSQSNMIAGSGPAWYLLDTTRPAKPIIYQTREPYALQSLDKDSNEHVFLRDEYLYGVRGRSNAGYGFWQTAFASKDALTPANYEAARKVMTSMRGDHGRPLGIVPNILLVPTELEGDGRRIINNQNDATGASNPWVNSAELIITPWLAAA